MPDREESAGGKGGHRGKAARRRPAFDEAEEDQPYRTSNRNEIGIYHIFLRLYWHILNMFESASCRQKI